MHRALELSRLSVTELALLAKLYLASVLKQCLDSFDFAVLASITAIGRVIVIGTLRSASR